MAAEPLPRFGGLFFPPDERLEAADCRKANSLIRRLTAEDLQLLLS